MNEQQAAVVADQPEEEGLWLSWLLVAVYGVLTPFAATVSGRVIDSEGRGISGARVWIRQMASEERHARSVWQAPATKTEPSSA